MKSARDFKKQMDEEFDYMVTVDVFDVAVDFDGNANGWQVERVYGSPGFEVPKQGRLTFMVTNFRRCNTYLGFQLSFSKRKPNNDQRRNDSS